MKKIFTYTAFVAVVIMVVSFIVMDRNDKGHSDAPKEVYTIKERKGPSAQTAEWVSTRTTANNLAEAIRKDAGDVKSRLQLAALFIQEARVTGNSAYYDAAAMKYVNDVLQKEPSNFEALVYKAIIQLSQHQFAEALATAGQAQTINPYNAFIYGIMVDAHVELGNYAAAVEYSDKMVSIKPDLRSYSRIAYLREIHGDLPGGIDAMKMAIEAGVPGNEGTEWCRIQLGQLYEQMGDISSAGMQYNTSLENRPGYAYALAGLARIAVLNKKFDEADAWYRQAFDMIPDPSFKEGLAALYRIQGKEKEAGRLQLQVIHSFEDHTHGEADQHDHGDGLQHSHNADRELAYAWLAAGNSDLALEHALNEYKRRPANIDVNEALAWIYYKKDDAVKALPHIKNAMKTNSKNPTLLARAGLIHYKAGEAGTALTLLKQALRQDPNIAPELKTECISTLRTLEKG